VIGKEMLREYLNLRGGREQEDGKGYTKRNYIICTLRQIPLGSSIGGRYDWRDMGNMRNAYSLVRKYEGKTPLERTGRRWEMVLI
jgi:hypothetical protein